MTQTFRIIASAAAAIGMMAAAGCSTPLADPANAKPDPRQGAEVRNVCFQSQIRGWRNLDNRSVIVEVGVRDEYKLELMGTCQPDDAFTKIGLDSRTSCLEIGDRVTTDARYDSGSCSIRRIFEWHKDAGKDAAATPPA
jgi:hypothetical protein